MKTLKATPSRMVKAEVIDDLLLFRIGRLLGSAGGMVIRVCEGEFGVTRREWRVLAQLAQGEGILSSALAQRAQLDRARTSRCITSLAAKGLLERRVQPSDRRQVHLWLTPHGRALYESLLPRLCGIHQDLIEVLARHEVDLLDDLLQRLQQRADQLLLQKPLPKANRRRGARAP